jgi:hypothetical protein
MFHVENPSLACGRLRPRAARYTDAWGNRAVESNGTLHPQGHPFWIRGSWSRLARGNCEDDGI